VDSVGFDSVLIGPETDSGISGFTSFSGSDEARGFSSGSEADGGNSSGVVSVGFVSSEIV